MARLFSDAAEEKLEDKQLAERRIPGYRLIFAKQRE
jgi:hypothetical protein